MRQLLKLIRDYTINEKGYYGLCATNCELYQESIITKPEYYMIMRYIDNHPSENYYKKTNPSSFDGYWWKEGSKAPRLRWLTKHIDKLK